MSEEGTETEEDTKPDTPEQKPKTFTQEDLNRVASREKKEGRAGAKREILEELGVDDLEAAKEAIAAKTQREEEQRTETEKALAKAAEAEAKAAKKEAELEQRLHDSTVKDALLEAGVDRKNVSRIVSMVTVEVGADEEAITEAVEELREDLPNLFTEQESDDDDDDEDKGPPKKKAPVGSDVGNAPPKSKKSKSGKDKAMDKLRERHPQAKAFQDQ